MTNKEYSKLDKFMKLCIRAGVQATARQASKFRRGKGLAFKKSLKGKE